MENHLLQLKQALRLERKQKHHHIGKNKPSMEIKNRSPYLL